MKMLKRLWQSWQRREGPKDKPREKPGENPKPTSFSLPLVDAEEFSRLLCSGRAEDLHILARRLSAEAKARV